MLRVSDSSAYQPLPGGERQSLAGDENDALLTVLSSVTPSSSVRGVGVAPDVVGWS